MLVRTLPRSTFRSGFAPHEKRPRIKIVGYIPEAYMKRIRAAVERSFNISEKEKKIILSGVDLCLTPAGG